MTYFDFEWRLDYELAQETALLALGCTTGVVVIDERDVLCALKQSVEGVCIDGVLTLGRVESEVNSQQIRNE